MRDFDRVFVWGRNAQRAARYRDDMANHFGPGVEIVVATDVEQLMRESPCVVTTTPSREPLLRAEWLHSGIHITAMVSHLPGKREVEADLVRQTDLVVCDVKSQATRLGELQGLTKRDTEDTIELGEISSGRHPCVFRVSPLPIATADQLSSRNNSFVFHDPPTGEITD